VEIVVLADRLATAAPPADRKLETIQRRQVDLGSVPVLADHVIDGHAVLPMALLLEWSAEAALQRNPGLGVRGVDDLGLFKGLVLNGREPAILEIAAGKAVREGDEFRVPVEFRGKLPNGREVIHARAEVVLAARNAAGSRRLHEPSPSRSAWRNDEIYGPVLFHGPAMQGIERGEISGQRGIAGRVRTSPPPSTWLGKPLRSPWLTDPLPLHSAFQLALPPPPPPPASNPLPPP